MLIDYKANVGDEIWTISNNSLVFGKIAQVSISVCPMITITYLVNIVNQSLVKTENEIFLDIVDALMALSTIVQDSTQCPK